MKYAVLVLGLLFALQSNAQHHLKDFALKRSLKQDGLHFQFTVLDSDRRGVRHHNPRKFYHWIKAQHVLSTQGASSGQLLHGTFEAFYQNKQLAQKGNYHKGLKHGTWRYWREDGTISHSEKWRHGKQCGKQLFFDETGQLKKSHVLRGGTLKQVQPDSVVVWKPHHRKKIVVKDSLGRKVSVEHFKNNSLCGTAKYYVDGKLERKEKYKKGAIVEDRTKKREKKEKEAETDEKVEKEQGKLKSLWNKWFSKDKEPKEPKEKKKKDKKPKEKSEK